VKRARSGKGPTLIECVIYRLSVHTTADDPSKYRSEDEVKKWKKRDPIPRFQNYLGKKKLLSKDEIKKLEEEIKEEIQGIWDETEKQVERLGDPLDMFEHIYREMPPYLEQQRDAFADFLKARKENHDG
jgi:pyruvate dehydrogenase E1 component alpha subunit